MMMGEKSDPDNDADNRAMLKVFHRAFPKVESRLEDDAYMLKMPFDGQPRPPVR